MRVKLIIAFILILTVSTLGLYFIPLPRYKTFIVSVPAIFNKEQEKEGKRIAQTICIRCHYNEQTETLAGKQHGNPERLGNFSSGNITQDSATGIGKWSNGQLYYFLKTGIKPDGNYVFDMPKYPNLSEDDLLSIIAFLKSNDSLVRKTYYLNTEPQYSLLTKFLLHVFIRPPHYNEKIVFRPDTNDFEKFGKYLATAKFSCFECHSLNMVTNNYNEPEKSWGFFKGGNPHTNEYREKIYSANISGDTINGIGKWSEDEFKKAVKHGIKPNRTVVQDPMFPFYLLSDKEVKAIYTYLRSVQ